MDRNELERMDREGLVLRAQAAGVRRARLLTRPELIDELLRLDPVIDESQLKRTRGFFGVARDLLSRVVERGLHLPDAADRLRAALGSPPSDVPRPEPQAVPTVTLAEIYAAQGHKQRAIETLQRVLEAEPDHGAARSLLDRLEASDYVGPPPALPPEPVEGDVPPVDDEEPEAVTREWNVYADADAALAAFATELSNQARTNDEAPPVSSEVVEAAPIGATSDSEEIPTAPTVTASPSAFAPRAAVAECYAVPLDRGRQYVCWHDAVADGRGTFVVRALVLVPTWDGPEQRIVDVPAEPSAGEMVLRDLPPRAIVRVAVGYVAEDGFTPIAHSPALETSSDTSRFSEWTPSGSVPVAEEGAIGRAIAAAERALYAP